MVDLSRDVDDLLTPNCIALKDIDSSYTFLTSDYNFKVLSFNIRSIHQYFNEFLVILHRSKVKLDLIVLTECWLSENIIIPQIPGYNSYQTQKYINKSGGVVVYVRDSWNAVVQESSCLDSNCLEIHFDQNLLVLAIYRSPSFSNIDNFLSSLDTILMQAKKKKKILSLHEILISTFALCLLKTKVLIIFPY
ncbi:unnamed protein product [Euphydryas editha]|uniref:Uncharacterized protein n=1 Tax=Euphydryas editha TaxID=104508 RepID=A0AAU9UGC8_EUPED|nr:unnamed protein product [Euphydryas editha]